MADPLFLSLWLKGYSPMGLPIYFRKALETFPHSRLSPGGVLRIHAVSFHEAAQLEEHFDLTPAPQHLASLAQEFLHQDCAFTYEARWDLWQWDDGWQLLPAVVSLECYGPLFESDRGEHVRLDLGPESLYLPHGQSDQLRPVQSNVRSLLHLASDLETALAVQRRLLRSATDEDFVARLKQVLGEGSD